MSKRLFFMAAPLLALQLVAAPAVADDAPSADTVVSTINGTDITLGHMISVASELPAQYQELPADVLFNGILDQLTSQTLLQQSISGTEPRKIRLAVDNDRRSRMAAAAIDVFLEQGPAEAEIQAAYEKQFKTDPGKEYQASHILVETEEEAQALVVQLNEGADFAALAKEHSTGPSGPSGGDLGWFGEGRMVAAFEEAVVALEPGKVSAPVNTQFGWHVILLQDTRIPEAPPLDQVRDAIVQTLREQRIDDHIESLRDQAAIKDATIDENGESRFDPAILKDVSLLEK